MAGTKKSEDRSKMEDYDESEETFSSSGWKMPKISSSIPIIAVNQQEVELVDQFESTRSSGSTSERKESLQKIKTNFPSESDYDVESSSESNRQEKIIRGEQKDGDSGIHHHLKFWRRKLLVLIWLNLLMRYRQRLKTFVELIFPIIALAFICGGLILNNRWKVPSQATDALLSKGDPFDPFNVMSTTVMYNYVCGNEEICHINIKRHFHIVYSPNNSFTDSLIEDVRNTLGLSENSETSGFFGVPTPEDVHIKIQAQWDKTPTPLARYPIGLVFSFSDVSTQIEENEVKSPLQKIEDNEDVPRKLKYTIRTFYPDISNTAENFPIVEHNSGPRTRHDVSPYIYTGFAGMQLAIDLAFIKKVKNKLIKLGFANVPDLNTHANSLYENYVTAPHVRMLEYPFFLDNRLRAWSAVVLTFIFSYACTNFYVVQDICTESKSGKIELLKLHGLTPTLHWIAYGITTVLMRVPTTLGMALILHFSFNYHALIPYQNPLMIWFFLFLHSIAQNCENFLIAHLFTSPTTGGMAVILISVVSFFLPLRLFDSNSLDRTSNIIMCFLTPQWNLANGLYTYLKYEVYEEGLHWYDFPVLIDADRYIIMPTQICCMISVYSIAIFFLLTVYVDKVVSKTYSPGISWWHCFKRFRRSKPETLKPSPPIDPSEMPKVYERASPDLLCTVRVRNLCKTYESEKSYKIALDNISLDIHEGEITAIIGMSGSGKTSLLHAIGGLIHPTSGFVEIKNLKVHEYSEYLNQFLSIVPQKCTLFPTLSTEDHVRFCCMIHGISYRKSKEQAKLLLQLFNLTGFKRHGHLWLSQTHIKKLTMAMALASAPTILLLDDPCNGMDIESSKQFWNYLVCLKPKRTIIITSSMMQDVELYSDRMAMISKGKLVCFGTPGKIRRHYSIGSILNLQEDGNDIKPLEVMRIINLETQGAIALNPLGYEDLYKTHRYLLPFGQSYAALLERLEDEMNVLKFSKLWVSRSEIGSIFYKISLSKGIESSLAAKDCFIADDVRPGSAEFGDAHQQLAHIDECDLKPTAQKQFSALFTKKLLSMKQKYPLIINEFIVPFLLMVVAMYFSPDFLQFKPESLAQPIHIGMYNQTLSPIRPASATLFTQFWFNAFTNALNNTPTAFINRDQNMMKYLEKGRLHHLGNFRQQIIVAFERDDQITTGYYSLNAYHSCPIALNAMANSLLYILSDNDKRNPYSIRISNYPEHPYEGFPSGSTQSNSTSIYAFLISLILAMIAAAELRLPIVEKHNDIKNIQFMLGVHPTMYWYTSFAGDFARNLIVVVILMGITCIMDIRNDQFSGFDERMILALVMFGYLCWTSIPYTYLISDLLNPTYLGYGHFLLLHFTLGIFPKILTYQMLRTETEGFPFYLRYILYLFPPYSITSALVHYLNIVSERNYCEDESFQSICGDYERKLKGDPLSVETLNDLDIAGDYNSLFRSCCKAYCEPEGICHLKRDFFIHAPVPALRADMLAMAIQGFFCWIMVILIEHDVPKNISFNISTRLFGNKEKKEAEDDVRDADESEDVKLEHLRVDTMIDTDENEESEAFFVQDVTKFYRTDKVIDHAFFTVPVGSITGILGLSKSGMTTLVKLLTGYCPQNNASYPDLTGFQTLQMMAKLRGVPDLQIDIHANRWLDHFALEDEAHVRCKTYRPGALRRLCCAMAMIGNPRILIFDNPTIGMDLAEHHLFWKAITRAREKGQTIIFTSPYAAEIQRCSQKVIVLDKGAISAVGRLTDVFKANARGLILAIRFRNQSFKKLNTYQLAAKIDQLRDHVIRHLSPCDLLLEEENILVYHLKDLTTKLSYAYGIMEGARENFPNLLDHFHIAEPSLDDVILNYPKTRQRASNADGNRRTIQVDSTYQPGRSNSV